MEQGTGKSIPIRVLSVAKILPFAGVAEMDWAGVRVLALAMYLDWTGQFIIVGVSTAVLAAASCLPGRVSRFYRSLALGLLSGSLLGAVGWVGLIEFMERQGAGSLSWVPEPILFGWPGDLMAKLYHFAPLIGALAGAFCGWLIIRLRRRPDGTS
jgi:hypothetical protein